MKVVDLFSGLGGWSQPFADNGHEVFRVELDDSFDAELHADILDISADDFPWRPDVVLASPPCTSFSVMRIGRNWTKDHQPRNDGARLGVRLVEKTVELIADLSPSFWFIENPRAKLRKLPVVSEFDRVTVTYCQYGERRMKATDLWGGFPDNWVPRPACKQGMPCHIAAPRGSRTGTQGMPVAESALIPYELADSIRLALEAQAGLGLWSHA